MEIFNYMYDYNYTATEDLERLFKPIADSLMNMVNTLITVLIIIIVVYLVYYSFSSILTRRKTPGIQTAINVVKDSVTSLNIIGDYIVVKTKNKSIYTFNDPISISIREIKPYLNTGYVLIASGLLFYILTYVLNIFNINILIVPSFTSIIVLIALVSSGLVLSIIRNNSLYIETKTGSKTLFTKILMNPEEAELVIYKYLQDKQEKIGKESEKKEQ